MAKQERLDMYEHLTLFENNKKNVLTIWEEKIVKTLEEMFGMYIMSLLNDKKNYQITFWVVKLKTKTVIECVFKVNNNFRICQTIGLYMLFNQSSFVILKYVHT